MGLFSFEEVGKKEQGNVGTANHIHFPSMGGGAATPSMTAIGNGKADEVARLALEHEQMWYLSEGKFSMHQLLEELLKLTGPAEVALCSWGITEDPARVLARLRRTGIITQLTCLFNSRVASNNAGAYQLISQVADNLGIAECHAKAISIINQTYSIGLISTANFSHNPRIECTVTQRNQEAAKWIRDWISHYASKNRPHE
jgi:hypothetical protein